MLIFAGEPPLQEHKNKLNMNRFVITLSGLLAATATLFGQELGQYRTK